MLMEGALVYSDSSNTVMVFWGTSCRIEGVEHLLESTQLLII